MPRPARLAPRAPRNITYPYVGPESRERTGGGSEHFHWTVQAFTSMEPETGQIFDLVTVELEAGCEDEAVRRAMEIIERPEYRVARVTEVCARDPLLREA